MTGKYTCRVNIFGKAKCRASDMIFNILDICALLFVRFVTIFVLINLILNNIVHI